MPVHELLLPSRSTSRTFGSCLLYTSAAARAAARAGARVVVCEREPVCGGELEFESATIDGTPAAHWVDATLTELLARGVRLLRQSAIVGGSDGLLIAHSEPCLLYTSRCV